MSPAIKHLLESCADSIEENDFRTIYQLLNYRYALSAKLPELAKELSDIFKAADINPLDYLDYVPATYAIGDLDLKEIILPSNIKTIDKYAFSSCENLKKINLDNITLIGFRAFYNCYSLTTVKFADDVNISREAFLGCRSLEEIYLPNKFSIGDYAFQECPLNTVYYDGTPQEWYDKH